MMGHPTIDNYRKLAAAIIGVAVEDYTAVWCHCRISPNDELAKKRKKDLEDFFLSEHFDILSDVDGEEFLLLLQHRLEKNPRPVRLGNL